MNTKKVFGVFFLAAFSAMLAHADLMCVGTCGGDTANGDVVNPPGFSSYSYVSTAGGVMGGGTIPIPSAVLGNETDGSTLTTANFSASAGAMLEFEFNFITSDGSGYPDYAWAELEDTSGHPIALLFTAQTQPTGNTSPGLELPPPVSTLTPSSSPIDPGSGTQCGQACNSPAGGPVWSELGSYSGDCWDVGCGLTGWITSTYKIPTAGNYELAFGVTNLNDIYYDSGLAFAGVQVAGNPIDTVVPEPSSWILFATVLSVAGFAVRRRQLFRRG